MIGQVDLNILKADYGAMSIIRAAGHDPDASQKLLAELFNELYRVLYDQYALRHRYEPYLRPEVVRDISPNPPTLNPLSLSQLHIRFAQKLDVPSPTKASTVSKTKSLKWAVKDRVRAEKLNDQFEDWLKRIREVIEDSCWPLPFFKQISSLQSVENDSDAQMIGTAEHAGLRKLLLSEEKPQPRLQLTLSLTSRRSFDGASRELAVLDGKHVLVEYLPYVPNSQGFLPRQLSNRFNQTAGLLHRQSDPDFRALHCLGYIDQQVPPSVELIFEIPVIYTIGAGPVVNTLLTLVGTKTASKPSLGSRLHLCYLLAHSLSLFHSVNWIHRAFRSENILFLKKPGTPDNTETDLTDPKISGFEVCRLESDVSIGPYDDAISRNVYRHPERWGIPIRSFTKYHDIYCKPHCISIRH